MIGPRYKQTVLVPLVHTMYSILRLESHDKLRSHVSIRTILEGRFSAGCVQVLSVPVAPAIPRVACGALCLEAVYVVPRVYFRALRCREMSSMATSCASQPMQSMRTSKPLIRKS
jgi:hypothetical protein